jgi:hypothetical protein
VYADALETRTDLLATERLAVGYESVVLRGASGDVVKISYLEPPGRRSFDAPVLGDGKVKVPGGYELGVKYGMTRFFVHFTRQPFLGERATREQHDAFGREVAALGYEFDDDGLDQLRRHRGRTVLIDPFAVRWS